MSYGKLAVEVVKDYMAKKMQNPRCIINLGEEWNNIAPKFIHHKPKDCPKATFLGICSAGYVLCIPRDHNAKKLKNGLYGESAIKLLKASPSLANLKSSKLWELVRLTPIPYYGLNIAKNHNQQMDVILGLWNKGYIV